MVLREWLFYVLAMMATSLNTLFDLPADGRASSTYVRLGYSFNYDIHTSLLANLFVNVAHNWPYVLCVLMLFRTVPQTLQDYLADTAVVNITPEAQPPSE